MKEGGEKERREGAEGGGGERKMREGEEEREQHYFRIIRTRPQHTYTRACNPSTTAATMHTLYTAAANNNHDRTCMPIIIANITLFNLTNWRPVNINEIKYKYVQTFNDAYFTETHQTRRCAQNTVMLW